MIARLEGRVATSLLRPLARQVRDLGERLGREHGAQAVLFYGSNLRTGELEGVLDYYLLGPGPAERGIWPRVSYHEWNEGGQLLRAKAATMTLEKFAQAASGELLDTTIWARFVQPSALIWSAGPDTTTRVIAALAAAAATASRLAAVLGPPRGKQEEFWNALFEATYGAEFRVEAGSRAQSILDLNRAHFDGLLPLALTQAGVAFDEADGIVAPRVTARERRRVLRWWSRRKRAGKPLNVLRLVRAAFTFEGAARYAAWKIERHTGIEVKLTPWRERHPVLAAPGILFSIWREKRRRRA